jgi:hypothetical protein
MIGWILCVAIASREPVATACRSSENRIRSPDGRYSISAVQEPILFRISERGHGTVFIAEDFLDIGSRDATDQTLSRLAKLGLIQRLGRGLYLNAEGLEPDHPVLSADFDEISDALGRQTGSHVVHSGVMAAHRLGLTTQVPGMPLYLMDGRSRQVWIGSVLFQLRHASPKHLLAASRVSSMVFQALRYIGKESINPRKIARVRRKLSLEQRVEVLRDASYATEWISVVVRQIARDEVEAPVQA